MKSEFKYGTPEYDLEEIKESVDEVLGKLKQFHIEMGQIIEFSPIIFGGIGWISGDARIKGGIDNGPFLDKFFNTSHYRSFNKTDKKHIEECFQEATNYISIAEKEVEVWHAENLPKIENNLKVRTTICNFMKSMGIPDQYSDTEYSGRSNKSKKVTKSAGYLGDITRYVRTTDGYDAAKIKIAKFKTDALEWKKKHLEEIEKKERIKTIEDKNIRLIAKALDLAKKYGINETDYTSNEKLIELVNEKAEAEFIEENYPLGITLDHSCCDSCSSWKVSEHRCLCGNRRMELIVDGNILDGFIAYPEAY